MNNPTQWQEILGQHPLGMAPLDINNEEQTNQSASNRPDERKKKSKLRLSLIKG